MEAKEHSVYRLGETLQLRCVKVGHSRFLTNPEPAHNVDAHLDRRSHHVSTVRLFSVTQSSRSHIELSITWEGFESFC